MCVLGHNVKCISYRQKSLKNCFEPCSAAKVTLQEGVFRTGFITYVFIFLFLVICLHWRHSITFILLIRFLLCLLYHILCCASF